MNKHHERTIDALQFEEKVSRELYRAQLEILLSL